MGPCVFGTTMASGRNLSYLPIIKKQVKAPEGKRNAMWTFTDEQNIVSQMVLYNADSVINIVNYNAEGKEENGDRFLEKPAMFAGGKDGWRKFLERNFRFPAESAAANVNGDARVQITIDKTGKISMMTLLDSPDYYTGQEALRLMRSSPNWEPARWHNRPIVYKFTQKITFHSTRSFR